MKWSNHLFLERTELAPSAEWNAECPGWCFVCVREGQGYWLGENSARELNPGHILILSPLADGFIRASQLGSLSLSHFRFSPELIAGVLTPAEKDSLESMASQPQLEARVLEPADPGARLFAALQRRDPPGNALLHRAELLQLVATLFEQALVRPVPAETVVLSARQKLRLLVNQIPEAEFLWMSPQEMALRCGNSLTHFNRSFRQLYGMSLVRKQELIRLQKARQALVETSSPIAVVAVQYGFPSPREFAAAFKAQFGISPKEWRRPKLRSRKPASSGSSGTIHALPGSRPDAAAK